MRIHKSKAADVDDDDDVAADADKDDNDVNVNGKIRSEGNSLGKLNHCSLQRPTIDWYVCEKETGRGLSVKGDRSVRTHFNFS